MAEYSLQNAADFIARQSTRVDSSLRPMWHLVPPVGWINDPNGFCFDGQMYHLFCQFHPYDAVWGPMHWAHYTSGDMLHWRWQGVSMAPDMPFDCAGCFSGTALPGNDGLTVAYTGVHPDKDGKIIQEQCLAVFQNGRMEKFSANPVVTQNMLPPGCSAIDFRDPKLYHVQGEYAMAVATRAQTGGCVLEYRSPDLFKWRYQQTLLDDLGFTPECPDVFTLNGKRVIILCALDQYQTPSRFEAQSPVLYTIGTPFSAENMHVLDGGLDFYAPQTLETPDGRRVLIGWMHDHHTDSPTHYLNHFWNGLMTMPRELRIQNGVIHQTPLSCLYDSRERMLDINKQQVENKLTLLSEGGESVCVELELAPSCAQTELRLFEDADEYAAIRYDGQALEFCREKCGYAMGSDGEREKRTAAAVPMELENGVLHLEIWLDRGTVEIFAAHGKVCMSSLAYVKNSRKAISLHTSAPADLRFARIWKVNAAPIAWY